MADREQPDLTSLTVQLLSAYVANNSVASNELANLIETTRSALAGTPQPDVAPEPDIAGAVSVEESLGSPEHLLSMIDGKPYKTLKRHLARHGLTPAEYRSRYKLPADYPMVAPSYSETRRTVARNAGLGRATRADRMEAPGAEIPYAEASAPTTPAEADIDAAPTATAEPTAEAIAAQPEATPDAPRKRRRKASADAPQADRADTPEEPEGTSKVRRKRAKPMPAGENVSDGGDVAGRATTGRPRGRPKTSADGTSQPAVKRRGRPPKQAAQGSAEGEAPA